MNNQNSQAIEQIVYHAHEIDIDWDRITPEGDLYQGTLTEIKNAWRNYAVVDNAGNIWVSINGLRSILRLSKRGKKVANIIVDNRISEMDKRWINNKRYIRGTAVGKLIDENIQSSRTFSKRNYSRFAQSLYIEFVRNPILELIRARYWDTQEKKIGKLKETRINRLKITHDELTGEKINLRRSHFSHIRSISLYPELAIYPWNGLIIDAKIHHILSTEEIHDEESLRDICLKNNWRIDWLPKYNTYLTLAGYHTLIE